MTCFLGFTKTYLELHQKLRENNRHFMHEFVHEFCHHVVGNTLLTKTEVEIIL